jgi:hypothetical protein
VLKAAFLDELARNFSSTASGSNSKYYTVEITGAGGLIETAFQNELAQTKIINGKPIRIVTLKRGQQAESKDLNDELKTTVTATWNPKRG